jgi:hypothetical protein
MIFSDVIQVVRNLSEDEKCEIQLLLQQYLRQERRDEIYANFAVAQVEHQNGKLTFSSDLNKLSQLIED